MKENIKKIIISFLLLLTIFICLKSDTQTIHAATVSKVTTSLKTTSNWKQYTMVYGKTNSGKIVWKYKTSTCYAADGRSATVSVKGSNVYIMDNHTFIRLNKQTGKVLVKKTNSYFNGWVAAMTIDSNGNCYSVGKYEKYLIKVNRNGKLLWKKNLTGYAGGGFVNKLVLSGNRIIVYYTNGKKHYYSA